MTDTTTINQQGQTITGTQLNAARDLTVGQIGDTYHYGQRPSYTPPPFPPQDELPPRGTIPPYSRMVMAENPHFVGREEELHQLAANLLYASDGEAQAITTHGMGGMGKSQLAVEYAYRYGRFYEGGVYWLSFAEPDSVESEIATCGRETAVNANAYAALTLPQQAAQTRRDWGDGKQRLLIFDNCEEPALFKQWRPQAGRCRLLLTSRRATWSSHLARTIKLDKLPRPQSVALLERLSGTTAPHFNAIADTVGDLPLALHLAGNYLRQYGHIETPETYLHALQGQLLQHASMHGRGSDDSPTDHAQSLTVTIAMSTAKLGAGAIDQLAVRVLACFARLATDEPITRTLLLEFADVQDLLDGDDALTQLLALGLLEAETNNTVKLHRTVAAYVQAEWKDDGLQTAVEQAVIDKSSTDNDSGYPAQSAAWLPHLRHVTAAALNRDAEKAATLATNLGIHLTNVGAYGEARPLFERALAIKEAQLGPDHPDTATCINNLAELMQVMGAYGEARPLFERALAIREAQLGSDHPDTGESAGNLGGLLTKIGQLNDALFYKKKALEIHEKALGSDHPYVATGLNNLASLMRVMGTYGEARPLFERALAIREAQLGSDHPTTAMSLNNLALLLKLMGTYGEARPLYERALDIREVQLGPDHPHTASSLNNLAELLRTMGAYGEARPLYERALAIHEAQLGSDHPHTAISLNNLAELLRAMEDYAEARPLFERALVIREAKLGADHPSTKITRNNLAALP